MQGMSSIKQGGYLSPANTKLKKTPETTSAVLPLRLALAIAHTTQARPVQVGRMQHPFTCQWEKEGMAGASSGMAPCNALLLFKTETPQPGPHTHIPYLMFIPDVHT